jgi:nicotinate-nucleotide pyrophosphorylase
MSCISTYTNKVVSIIKDSKTKILDTRKTTPNLRALEAIADIIMLDNISRYASLGVDFISLGALTHSAPCLDIIMKNLVPLSYLKDKNIYNFSNMDFILMHDAVS